MLKVGHFLIHDIVQLAHPIQLYNFSSLQRHECIFCIHHTNHICHEQSYDFDNFFNCAPVTDESSQGDAKHEAEEGDLLLQLLQPKSLRGEKVSQETFHMFQQTEQTRSKSIMMVLLQKEVSNSHEVQGILLFWEQTFEQDPKFICYFCVC